jgi:hypothetical protein
MSLAQRLRYPSIRQMLRELDSRDIADWLAYFRIEAEHIEQRRLEAEAVHAAFADLQHMKRGD